MASRGMLAIFVALSLPHLALTYAIHSSLVNDLWEGLRSDDVYQTLHESCIGQHVINLAFQYTCDWDIKSGNWTWRCWTRRHGEAS